MKSPHPFSGPASWSELPHVQSEQHLYKRWRNSEKLMGDKFPEQMRALAARPVFKVKARLHTHA